MSNFTTEFKVGLFTVLGASVLTSTAVILGGNPFAKQKQHFSVILFNANGIAERTQVRTSGVQVGAVTNVKILPDGAEVEFDVNNGVRIPKGSIVDVKSRGVLGDVYIEIERNEKEPENIHSGVLALNPEKTDLDTLLATMNAIGRDIKKVSNSFAHVLGTAKGEKTLQNIVDNIDGISSDLREVSSSQKKNLKETIQNLRDVAVNISGLIKRNDTKIDSIIDNINALSFQLKKLISKENREQFEHIIANIDDSATSLKKLLAKVERGEGTLGQLIVKDDTADEVKQTLKNIQEVIKPIADLKLTLRDKGEFRIANAEKGDHFVNQFDLTFATRPDRYYLLGIVSAPYGRKVENTTTTTSIDGNKTITNSQVNTPELTGSFRYNAQISQRFDFLGVRVGLFSSSAGFAGDFYTFNDKLVGSLEFSQFDGSPVGTDNLYGSKGSFNIKAYASLYLTSNIFITGGVDGLVLYNTPLPFLGAGLSITDDDIKGLFGVASLGSR